MGIETAIIGGALVGGAATMFGSSKASSASNTAADAQSASTQANIDLQWKMFKSNEKRLAPWTNEGKRALEQYGKILRSGPGKFNPEQQPGYRFGFKEFIEEPYLSSQSAKGSRLSGATIKGLTKYAGDYAESSYDNFLARYENKVNRFANAANMGQASAAQTAVLSQSAGQNIGQNYLNMGNAQAQNAMNQGNIATQAGAAFGGIAQGATQNYLDYAIAQKTGVI